MLRYFVKHHNDSLLETLTQYGSIKEGHRTSDKAYSTWQIMENKDEFDIVAIEVDIVFKGDLN